MNLVDFFFEEKELNESLTREANLGCSKRASLTTGRPWFYRSKTSCIRLTQTAKHYRTYIVLILRFHV